MDLPYNMLHTTNCMTSRPIEVVKLAQKLSAYVHEGEGDQSADDDERVEYVPEVATVSTRVKKYSTIYDLQPATKQISSLTLEYLRAVLLLWRFLSGVKIAIYCDKIKEGIYRVPGSLQMYVHMLFLFV